VFLQPLLAILSTLHGAAAYAVFFALLLCSGIGAPLGQDALLLASAEFTLAGAMQPVPLAILAWLAIVAADALSLFLGHHYGARWIRRPWAARFVAPERLPALEDWFRRWALPFSFLTRFLPGQRATLFFIAGTLRMPYRPFFIGNGLAALVQVPLFVWGVRSQGWRWVALQERFDRADDLLTAALVLLVLFALWTGSGRAREGS
jgi:membrane protein DedA with SNARE-associated domain